MLAVPLFSLVQAGARALSILLFLRSCCSWIPERLPIYAAMTVLPDALLPFSIVPNCIYCLFCYSDAVLSKLDGIEASRAKREKEEGFTE